MDDLDALVIYSRSSSPNGIDAVTDTYVFEPYFRNGQVKKMVVSHQPGHGFRTTVFIEGMLSTSSDYPEGQWGPAKADLEEVLRQYQCDLFTIKDPRQS
jgi:hypothetical protein